MNGLEDDGSKGRPKNTCQHHHFSPLVRPLDAVEMASFAMVDDIQNGKVHHFPHLNRNNVPHSNGIGCELGVYPFVEVLPHNNGSRWQPSLS